MQQRLYMKWVYVVSSVHQSLHTHLGSVCANLYFYKISLKQNCRSSPEESFLQILIRRRLETWMIVFVRETRDLCRRKGDTHLNTLIEQQQIEELFDLH